MGDTLSVFMSAMAARRSLLLSEEEALAGNTLVSVETCPEFGLTTFYSFIEEHFDLFLITLRLLTPEDQELLINYFILGKTQMWLSKLNQCTQTGVSTLIRRATKVFGCMVLFGGRPTEEILARVFTAAGVENRFNVALSTMVMYYVETQSFKVVAKKFRLKRELVRKTMGKISVQLEQSTDREQCAIGSWFVSILDKHSAEGVGLTKRQLAKAGHYYHRDSELLGGFTIPVQHPDFQEFCTAIGWR
jgi:hypothetical protein